MLLFCQHRLCPQRRSIGVFFGRGWRLGLVRGVHRPRRRGLLLLPWLFLGGFIFCGWVVWLLGFGESLISGCLFFLASDRRRESSRHYLEKLASVYLQSTYQKMAFCMIKTLRLQISRKSHGILLRTINHPYGRRFGYTSYLFKHCLYKHTSIQLPPSLRPNMSALR